MSVPDSSTTIVQTPQQVSFLDERPESSDPIISPAPIRALESTTSPDSTLSAQNLLQNPIQIDTFTWTDTQASGAIITSYRLPEVFTSKDSFHRQILGIYAFLKCNLILTFKLNSTRFHAGGLWMVLDPMHQMLDSRTSLGSMSKFSNIWSNSSQPRVEIDAAQSNVATMTIPFHHVQNRLTTNSKESWDVMALLRVMVASPLRAAAGTQGSVTCQVFLHCSDVELGVPIYPHVAIIPSLMHSDSESELDQSFNLTPPPPSPNYPIPDQIRSLLRLSNRLCGELISINAHIRSLMKSAQPLPSPPSPTPTEMHGLTDDIGGAVKGAVGAAANVATGNFGKAASSASSGLKSASGALSSFNLDKPADPDVAVTNCIYPIAPPSHGVGIDRSIRLGNAPVGAYLRSQMSGNVSQDMNLRLRAQVPGLVDSFSWTVDDTAGTLLKSIPVLPSYCHTEPVTDPDRAPGYFAVYNTPASYISELFVYWKGSMDYMLKAYATQFHSGRLMMTFTPNQRVTAPSGLSQYTNLPAVYFDLQGDSLVAFKVPFDSSLSRKTYAPWATVPSRSAYTDAHILGYMDIVVLNPLVAPSNVFGNINLLLFQAFGSDVEFESPRLLNTSRFIVPSFDGSLAPTETIMHSDETSDLTERSINNPEPLSKSAAPLTPIQNVFNEGIEDMRDLARRFTPIQYYLCSLNSAREARPLETFAPTNLWSIGKTVTVAGVAKNFFVSTKVAPLMSSFEVMHVPIVTGGGTPDPQYFNEEVSAANSFHNRIARLHVFFHGSMRFKIIPLTDRTRNLVFAAHYVPDNDINVYSPSGNVVSSLLDFVHPYSAYSSMFTNTSQQCALEVETPFMSGYDQLLIETVEPTSSFPPDVLNMGAIVFSAQTDKAEDFPTNDFPSEQSGPALQFILMSAAGDDCVYHYNVAPPVTYVCGQLVPPP